MGSNDIKLFLTDVDGCLTDGGLYYSASGDESKRFCVYDGMGMVLLKKAGIACGIITSESSEIVKRRAERLHLDFLYMGVGRQIDDSPRSKLDVCREICAQMGIELANVCYVGDDINDLDLLQVVGYPACPRNARPEVKAVPNIWHLEHCGGDGAIRELTDKILKMR